MEWQTVLYLGLWCILLAVIGFLIWVVRLVSGSNDQVLMIMYYGCAMAALIVLCVLILTVSKFKANKP